ncbi:hypothetical protein BD289DRAFT_250331 [Coniella lustricola]|uniref:Uncharacterized protein n=1 Tax=Coniella lustricola TaxID=2025994 RepID=A0A2T3A8S0_9PEZI|nr:hypothetical protein BD289DRAFT_250331 [Coniella lustricola]
MSMAPVTPEPQTEPESGSIASPVVHRIEADFKDVKRPRAIYTTDQLRQTFQMNVSEPEEKTFPSTELPAGFNVPEGLKPEVPALAGLMSPVPYCPISKVSTANRAPPVTPVEPGVMSDEEGGPSWESQTSSSALVAAEAVMRLVSALSPEAGQDESRTREEYAAPTANDKQPKPLVPEKSPGRFASMFKRSKKTANSSSDSEKPATEMQTAIDKLQRLAEEAPFDKDASAEHEGGSLDSIDTMILSSAQKNGLNPAEAASLLTDDPKGKLDTLRNTVVATENDGGSQDDGNTSMSMVKLNSDINLVSKEPQRVHQALNGLATGVGSKDYAGALTQYQEMLQSGGADPLIMLRAEEAFDALDITKEIPAVRTHSLSEDTMVASRPQLLGSHSITADALVTQSRAIPSHVITQGKVINATPSKRGGHRLSTDLMVPTRAAAPSHYLEADPVLSAPQRLFSHELLEDRVVEQPMRRNQAHDLHTDEKLHTLQRKIRAHELHTDVNTPALPKSSGHSLHQDIAVLGPRARSAHELRSDKSILSGISARKGHEMWHDVRVLSPSGAVRDPHSLGNDAGIKESTVFRKSLHPEARIPGNWTSSRSSDRDDSDAPNNDAAASADVSLQNSGQALEELTHTIELPVNDKENDPAGMLSKLAPRNA